MESDRGRERAREAGEAMGGRRAGERRGRDERGRGTPRLGGTAAPLVIFGAALALGLLAYGLVGPASDAPARATPPVSSPRQLYASRYRDGGLEFLPIDPRTLADLPGRPVLRIPELALGQFTVLVSADGSTIAVMQYVGALADAEAVTIRIVEARTGEERARFRTPGPVEMQYLSVDGSRLFGWGPAYRPEPQRRFAWDMADGRLLAAVPTGGFLLGGYDAHGGAAYGLAVPDRRDNRLSDATLVAQDALSGRELGRVRLAGVPIGARDSGVELGGRRVFARVEPDIAVSPDGRRVAVLHGDGGGLTLVDAATMRVLWTRPLARAPGVADPTPPPPAGVKVLEHTYWYIQFSPDGRYLYTYGIESWLSDVGQGSPRPLGLRVIEVERAEIVAHTNEGESISPFAVAPDGSALYLLGPRRDAPVFGVASVLRRYDPPTLAVTAEREFEDGWTLRLAHLAERRP